MTITLDGTNGITTPAVTNNGAYTGDGISFADGTPSNTLVTTTGGNVGIGVSTVASSGSRKVLQVANGANGAAILLGNDTATATNNARVLGNSGTELILAGGGASGIITAYTNDTERMRIDSSGNLLVNTSTQIANSAGNLQVSCTNPSSGNQYGGLIGGNGTQYTVYAMRFVNTYTPSIVGSITIGGSSTSYNTSSDYRLKENIAPMTSALATVAQLKPVTYTWKEDGSQGQGFIAHELQEVVPDCVTGEKDAVDEEGNPVYQGIDTSFLVATLTAAIQELKAELDTVKTELATLKGTA